MEDWYTWVLKITYYIYQFLCFRNFLIFKYTKGSKKYLWVYCFYYISSQNAQAFLFPQPVLDRKDVHIQVWVSGQSMFLCIRSMTNGLF